MSSPKRYEIAKHYHELCKDALSFRNFLVSFRENLHTLENGLMHQTANSRRVAVEVF